jgi:glycosyltransferase involved in cell wall biosynthesis
VGDRFDGVVLFGRTVRGEKRADYVPVGSVDLVELPHYESLRDLPTVLRATSGTIRAFWEGLARVDTIWIYGPHPFSLFLVGMALARRRRIVLGVRQDTVPYYRGRLPSARWTPFLLAARGLDAAYRLLSRSLKTTVVGPQIARRYGLERRTVLPMTVSLIRAGDVVPEAASRDWSGTVELLSVGRLEPEKNPFLLVDALARLERGRPGRYRLTWLGQGRLRDAVLTHAKEMGVAHALDLRGFVAFGPDLLDFYRSAHLFVHVSLTEGVPQVLIEALASGTPIVATDVGSVAATLDHGRAGMLIPPQDPAALVAAVLRMTDDAELRTRMVGRGLELARERTLEAEADRVARFMTT